MMNDIDILEKIQPIFKDVFDDEELVVAAETTAADVEDWDSFAQMQIVMGIEEEFDIEIPTDAAEQIVTVGDAVEQIKNALT